MGYDAMALGPRELLLGHDVLARRMEEARFPMLSANVVLTGTDELFAQPYMVIGVGGRQVGVIGLTRVPGKPRTGFEVLDPQEAAARYVPEVADQADVVVILTNLRYQSALELAAFVSGIDVAIAALPGQPPTQLSKAQRTGTLVVCAEHPAKRHTGRQVGRLAVTIESDGTVADEYWISKPLTKDIPDDPEMRALLASYGQ
jgi:2',3'-cyclic-nucleotide 2'-phosphodiesterase (5'-nucleotidase family)